MWISRSTAGWRWRRTTSDPKAYKQNDVVTACNGTTIEVIHTDAEGRMVLADTLALASKGKPGLMIDYATLTGSCVAGPRHTLQRRLQQSPRLRGTDHRRRPRQRRTRLALPH